MKVWQDSEPTMKAYIAKCAELRAISAVQFVRSLHQFVLDARADGHQL